VTTLFVSVIVGALATPSCGPDEVCSAQDVEALEDASAGAIRVEMLQTKTRLARVSEDLNAQEPEECKDEGEICWVDAECCSSRCLRDAKCAPPLPLKANESAELLSREANEPVEANLSHEAHECKDEGEVCWVDAECCSSRCLRDAKCAPLLPLKANESAEANLSHEAHECKDEGEVCWMDAECCSSRCLADAKCAAPLVLQANESAEAILSHEANRSAELLQANGSLARSFSCKILPCGCPPYKQFWCNEDSANMDDAWCHGSVGNCATCHGLWCAAAMLEASANQTAERLAGVASKSGV